MNASTRTPRRRTLAPFLIGLSLVALIVGSLEAGLAAGVVSRAGSPIAFIVDQVQARFSANAGAARVSEISWSSQDAPSARRRRKVAGVAAAGPMSLPRHSVCVRLCDGYFFPIAPVSRADDLANQEASCAGLCPDAPTELFVEPAGSDKIEDAVSVHGGRYSALPVAFRNRVTVDHTCACHKRFDEAYTLSDDATLRKGDSVMTSTGILVFRGGGQMPYARNDFSALAVASMSKEKKAVLVAIERAALRNPQQTSEALLSPRRSLIAFAPPAPERPVSTPLNRSIRFLEPIRSATN